MAEYIDILTPEGELTGKVKSREDVHREGDWHHTAHIWIVTAEDEVLLQKRSDTKENHPGLWDISCAGHIEAGESVEDGGLREIREELGIQIDKSFLQLLYKSPHKFILNEGAYIDNEWNYVFLVSLSRKPDVKFDTNEINSVRWDRLSEFKKLIKEKSEQLVPHWEEYERFLETVTREK